MTLGQARVRIKFNPEKHTLVDEIKQKAAELIDLCEEHKLQMPNAEIGRLWSLAQTQFEDGAMWAVKAATG
jgi:hypothetical protein